MKNPKKPIVCRYGTQDFLAVSEVYEQNEYELPDQFEPGSVIIDIGAHIGTFARACLDRGAHLVYCFEPDEWNRTLLLLNTDDYQDRIRIDSRAVWSDTGSLLLVDKGEYTAMHYCIPLSKDAPSQKTTEIRCLGIRDLLGLVGAHHRPIDLLKIDAEGAEVPILDAATTESMNNVQKIIGEIHYQMAGNPTNRWLAETLDRLGFNQPVIKRNRRCPNLVSLFFATRKPIR